MAGHRCSLSYAVLQTAMPGHDADQFKGLFPEAIVTGSAGISSRNGCDVRVERAADDLSSPLLLGEVKKITAGRSN
jgi:hypothetical protein